MMAGLIHSLGRYDPQPDSTLEALIARLEELLLLDRALRDAGFDVHKEDGLYEAEVLPGLAVWQFLFEPREDIDHDTQRLLQLTVDSAVLTTLPDLEAYGVVGELGPWPKHEAHNIDAFDMWIALLRNNLNLYRGDCNGFLEECYQAFPDFVFSKKFPDCLNTFKGDLNDFISVIVSALVSLAEDMPECMEQPTTVESMKAFTAKSGYETSLEGDANRKDALTFLFAHKEGSIAILCEPHIKLHRSARAGDTEYYFHRIYFSNADHGKFKGKTLIGHIGEHL